MKWIQKYQFVLFDFDGLLVNTESIHFKAYQRVCKKRGYDLNWDWPTYCYAAHYSPTRLRDMVYQTLPNLKKDEPDWQVLYEEKKAAYLDLLNEGAVELMPGVKKLLEFLSAEQIPSCVVTHSPAEQIEMIRRQQPVLNLIPKWITREHYSQPKPHPECYQLAISKYASPSDQVIGFEDTFRGLKALLGTSAHGVLISTTIEKTEVENFKLQESRQISHFSTFESIQSLE